MVLSVLLSLELLRTHGCVFIRNLVMGGTIALCGWGVVILECSIMSATILSLHLLWIRPCQIISKETSTRISQCGNLGTSAPKQHDVRNPALSVYSKRMMSNLHAG